VLLAYRMVNSEPASYLLGLLRLTYCHYWTNLSSFLDQLYQHYDDYLSWWL